MKRKTKLYYAVCLVLLAGCFCSCNKAAPIVVTSFDYPELEQVKAVDFDATAVNDVENNWDSYPYKEYS